MAKTKKIRSLPCYRVGDFPYEYAYCPDVKSWRRHFKALGDGSPPPYPSSKTGGRCTFVDGFNSCVVTVGSDNTDEMVIDVLVHEAVHVFQEACEVAGEDTPSSEFQAYSIQHIFSNLYQEYKKAARK
jgi:hypothetical protein